MFQLVYCSVASAGFNQSDIKAILHQSRTFNREHAITGCLLYHQGEFIQILEGSKIVVQQLFNKIKQDRRHTNVILMSEEFVENRIFDNWSMAYCEYDPDGTGFKNYLFKQNFIALSELSDKPTETVRLFFYAAKQMLETGSFLEQNIA